MLSKWQVNMLFDFEVALCGCPSLREVVWFSPKKFDILGLWPNYSSMSEFLEFTFLVCARALS
jgi:hypothetical protein